MALVTSDCGAMCIHDHQMALITSGCAPFQATKFVPTAVARIAQHTGLPGWILIIIFVGGGVVSYKKREKLKAAWAGEPWPTAAIPMENPYCSCKLTGPRAMAHSCNPYGESLLQL